MENNFISSVLSKILRENFQILQNKETYCVPSFLIQNPVSIDTRSNFIAIMEDPQWSQISPSEIDCSTLLNLEKYLYKRLFNS